MNIDPLKNSGFLYQTRVNGRSHGQEQTPAQTNDSDRLSAELSEKVRNSLASLPEVRPEVVERGRQLRADPSYPSREVVEKIARLITPLSED